MSVFSAKGDFVLRLPAHPLRADAPTDSSFGRFVATSYRCELEYRDHLILPFNTLVVIVAHNKASFRH